MNREFHDELPTDLGLANTAGRRVALVIGNAAYRKPGTALTNPPQDAHDIAAALGRLGFELITMPSATTDGPHWHRDVDLNTFGTLLGRFARASYDAEMAVLYYAGHGIEVNGTNYLIPVSAELDHVSDLEYQTRQLPSVLSALQGAKKLRLLILDACRNNPFGETMRGLEGLRSFGASLRQPEPPGNTLVFYAARHGTTAKDGKPGANSPFATALLRHIETPDLELLHLFGEVADDVRELTGHAQEPYVYGTKGRAMIYLKQSPQRVVPPPPAPGQNDTATSHLTLMQLAGTEWERIKDTINIEHLEFFEKHFPNTYYAEMARERIETLKHAEAEQAKAEAVRRQTEELSRRHEADWQTAEREGTVAALEKFLAAWTGGPHVTEARQKLAALQAQQRAEAEQRARDEQDRREGRIRVQVGAGANDKLFSLSSGESAPRDIDIGPELVLVPPGKFRMGEKGADHEVTIGYPLLVGKYPVTFAEWDAAQVHPDWQKHTGIAPRKLNDHGWGRAKRPVIDVNWADAKAFSTWLGKVTGKPYRLLSEAEWEYCCRAGTTTGYSFGETITKALAQFSEGEWGSAKQTADVGKFPANAFGLHDMHGNVWEWCEDPWHETYDGAPQDGSVWSSGDDSRRVLRGGSWSNFPVILRSAYRYGITSVSRNNLYGFRVARSVSR